MNNESKDTRTLLQKKADAFLVLRTKVHISLNSGNWKRGIIESVEKEFIILNESLEGKIPLFFEEINSIEAYTPKRGENNEGGN